MRKEQTELFVNALINFQCHNFHGIIRDSWLGVISMTNTHHATMEELVIGKDLSWMDSYPAVHEPEMRWSDEKT
ncbi:MAG: hypothetical protein WCI64_08090 [Chlorobium sp.]